MNRIERISAWIADKVRESGAEGAVVGLSGGIDSAVTAVLTRKALASHCLGLIMPCQSSPGDENDALMLASRFDILVRTIRLNSIYTAFLSVLPQSDAAARANLKARLRMITLYYYARTHRYLVVGTGNKSELMVGYFTKYGDGGVDLLPLGNLLKTEVRKIAEELRIPRRIIRRVPSAGLLPDQTDEAELGLSYEKLDGLLGAIENGETSELNPEDLSKVETLIQRSKHKRERIPICEQA